MKATKTSSNSKIVADILENRNGVTQVVHKHLAVGSNGYFATVSTQLVNLCGRVFLSYVDEAEKSKPSYGSAESFGTFQYEGSRKVVNEEGFTTRHSALSSLSFLNLAEEYLPSYSPTDLASSLTHGELGYLLTYAVGKEFPKLGSFQLVDPRMKVSVISVESTSGKRPEYRLGQYYTGKDFASYLENLKEGSRPVPLPLFYGFMKYFGDKNVTLLGEVPRGVFLELATSLKEGIS